MPKTKKNKSKRRWWPYNRQIVNEVNENRKRNELLNMMSFGSQPLWTFEKQTPDIEMEDVEMKDMEDKVLTPDIEMEDVEMKDMEDEVLTPDIEMEDVEMKDMEDEVLTPDIEMEDVEMKDMEDKVLTPNIEMEDVEMKDMENEVLTPDIEMEDVEMKDMEDEVLTPDIEMEDVEMKDIEDEVLTPDIEMEDVEMKDMEDEVLNFKLQLKSERTFAKNATVERNYSIILDETWKDLRVEDGNTSMIDMFDNVIKTVSQEYDAEDKMKVTINHPDLTNPITIPPKPLNKVYGEEILEKIERVVTSNQDLTVDNLDIVVGFVKMPSGGVRRRIVNTNRDIKLKKSMVQIENNDFMCAARAISVGYAKLCMVENEEFKESTSQMYNLSNVEKVLESGKCTKRIYKDICTKDRPNARIYTQRMMAKCLCEKAGVPTDRCISIDELSKFEDVLCTNVCVVSCENGNKFVRVVKDVNRKTIYLYLHEGHYDCISSITGFFSTNCFCEHCMKPYDHKERHKCTTHCNVCLSDNCIENNIIECPDCHQKCRGQDCLQRHKVVKFKNTTMCESFYSCQQCHKVMPSSHKEIHTCGEYYCHNCESFVNNEHLCFLRAVKPKASKPNFIFYDFETTQESIIQCSDGYVPNNTEGCENCSVANLCNTCFKCRHCHKNTCGCHQHIPNLVIAHTVCEHCYNTDSTTCTECGIRCRNCTKKACEYCPKTKEVLFRSADDFYTWLLSDQYAGFTCIAHNAKAFDGYFLLDHLAKHGIQPQIPIFNGTKLMYVEVKKRLNIRFIDSYNFLSMKLCALPKAFGLTELKKGYFPHLFNTAANQNYKGCYPPPEFYGVDSMMKEERVKFMDWYDAVKDQEFDFEKEFIEYCRSDVDILKQACLKYRNLMLEAADVDPFQYITTASVCMTIFKTKFLEEIWHVVMKDGCMDEAKVKNNVWKLNDVEIDYNDIKEKSFISSPLAQMPAGGYTTNVSFSKESIQWMEWEAKIREIEIQHALNGYGEKKIGKYSVDGYCEETKTVFEYNGCFWHGCPKCYPVNRNIIKNVKTGQSMEELYCLTKNKESYLKACGYNVISKWSHEFTEELKTNVELKAYVRDLDLVERLDPRDSFFGGRTSTIKLHHKVNQDEEIRYVDFTSLYPYVNKYKDYVVGHPEIITRGFKPLEEYFGIAKVKMLPPRGLYIPVLPYKYNNKLKFPLCRTCVETESQERCTCSDEDRCLMGTWCIPEILKAIEKGYIVQKIYEVYHFKQKSDKLFREYVDTFLKFKQESSDWPINCKMNEEEVNLDKLHEVNANRERYLRDYYEQEGVRLDRSKICKNPGLRSLSKINLNSFWGKFGQRLNFDKCVYFNSEQLTEFYEVMSNPTLDVKDFHIISENLIMVKYCHKDYQIPMDNVTNIFVATFTTCMARLKLYEVMEQLNERVLYHDTDSIIYIHKENLYNPPLGNYLGELTDELNGESIVEFVSGGAKNYAYVTNKGTTCCKVRGFRLNYANSQRINFDVMKEMVTKDMQKTISTSSNKILRDRQKCVLYNKKEKKEYRMVFDKRVIDKSTLMTYPYGY